MLGRKKEEELKSQRVVIHVTEKEKNKIKEMASDMGMDISTFIRTKCIYNQLNNFIKKV